MFYHLTLRSFFFLCVSITSHHLYSQNRPVISKENFPFQHIEYIGNERGLNGNEIQGMTQDKHGFMWFLTDNGLNRFDGYSFRSFAYGHKNPEAPVSGVYSGLTADDHNNKIWVASRNSGIYSFDKHVERFSNFRYQPGKKNLTEKGDILSITAKNDGTIWCALPDGLYNYNVQNRQFTWFAHDDADSTTIDRSFTKEILFDKESKHKGAEDELWVVNDALTIELFNTRTGKVERRFRYPHSSISWEHGFYILGIRKRRIWMGSDEKGIHGFDIAKEQFITIDIAGNYNCTAEPHGLHPAFEDHAGNIWTSNDNNEIVFYDRKKNRVYHYKSEKKFTGFNYSWPSVYEDLSHRVWFGTYEGLIAIDNEPPQIVSLRHNGKDPSTISSDMVCSIFKNSGGQLFVGTGRTIDLFDRKSQAFSHHKSFEQGEEIFTGNAWYIKEDSKGTLWITNGERGLIAFHPITKKYKHHRLYDSTGIMKEGFVGIEDGKNGEFWTINYEYKICRFNPVTGKTKVFPIHREANSNTNSGTTTLFMDSRNMLYTAIWQGGLVVFDTEKETYKIYKPDASDPYSLSQGTATPMIETKKGLIWIITLGGGINVFDPLTEKFKTYTTADGLAHNITSAIIEDKSGNYWVSTRGGLSRFKPPDDPFAPGAKITFRNYDISDGLPSNDMNMLSAYCDADGTLFFGTRSAGLFYFHPDSLKDNPYKPSVVITEFQLKNQPVSVRDSNSILKTTIEYTKEIRLNYRQNIISFSFAALNFIHPEKNSYAYMLEGYDKDWIYTDASKRFASYTNLDHGTYTFKVRGSNNDGHWNETPIEIKIIITPPFWQTLWFQILVGIAVAGILYAFYRYRIGQILLLQRIRNKIAADLHDDIGSTLNSISVYSEVARKDEARKDFALTMIGESSRKIIESMSDIVWSINPENDSFDKLIFRMRSLAYNITKAKKIDCTFKADESLNAIKLSMHTRRNFYLIYKEALNNLVKYSEAIRASVVLMHDNRQVVMIVRDDGVGFDVNAKHNGNGLNNIRRRAGEINAKVNIDSLVGTGTTVELNLRIKS